MAGRPEKHTVNYFQHDAVAGSGRTLTILFNRFQHEGISCWWLLLEELARSYDHIINITRPEDFEYLSGKLHFPPEKLRGILEKMAELDAIDRELYSHGYIWSQNFVERLNPVYASRKQQPPTKPVIISQTNPISSEEIPISLPDNTHSRESILEGLEGVDTSTENTPELLNEIRALPGWKIKNDDQVWFDEFQKEFPLLSISVVRKCRDYHISKHPQKNHIWKTALRNWLENEREKTNGRPSANIQSGNESRGIFERLANEALARQSNA